MIIGVVVGLTFLFGFGNVLNLALRLGVPVWVAPLVAPAVDLSILGLLLGTRHLALAGATPNQLQPPRRLLLFASVVTLALNVADPIVAGEYGKAAFDAVGPLLLIGWAEVGPDLLRALSCTCRPNAATPDEVDPGTAVSAAALKQIDDQASAPSATGTESDAAQARKQREARTVKSGKYSGIRVTRLDSETTGACLSRVDRSAAVALSSLSAQDRAPYR